MTDLRHALRSFAQRPLFTGVVVVTIALGIASTTVVFSVVNGVLLRALPYAAPSELVMVWEHNVPRSRAENVVSPANFLAWRERSRSFKGLAAVVPSSTTLTGEGEPERVGMMMASAELYSLLGVTPVAGRLYTVEEDREGSDATAVLLGYGFWQRRFGGDAGVIGRRLELSGNEAVVVGVLPETFGMDLPFSFGFTGTQDLWIPLRFGEEARSAGGRWLQVVARLAPGVAVEGARAEMSALAAELEREHPQRQTGWTVNVVPLKQQMVGNVATVLLVILGAVGFVLLIACANVANLLLARANDRQQEMAVRTALGASAGRVVKQLMVESVVLAAAGGVVGVVLAFAALRGLIALGPDIPRLDELAMDGTVLLFAGATTISAGLLFGLAPMLRLSRPDLIAVLRERGADGAQRERHRMRGALVVAEIALSLVLLVGAGLLIRSFGKLVEVGVGFDPERLLVADMQLPSSRYPDAAARARFYEGLVERLKPLPGVTGAAAITFAPLAGTGSATSYWANDRPVPEAGQHPVADIRWVQRDYFRTLGIPLLVGRTFGEGDRADAPLRVVVTRALVSQIWPDESPIGKTISMPWGDTLVAEVIGVVGDVRHEGPETAPRGMIYWDHRQFAAFQQMSVVLRTTQDPAAHISAVRSVVQSLDAELPIYNVRSMESYFGDALARARFAMLAIGLFALVALALAAIGIYGVMSYAVGQRVREIGIRLALGADPLRVVKLVAGQGLVLVGIATAIGVAGSLALTRLLGSLVYEVSTRDPLTLAAMTAVLAAVAVAACVIPALRASRVDPLIAIRYD